jgi:hypothetical protein
MTGRSGEKLRMIVVTAMTIFAVVGLISLIAFVTVGWPGTVGRYVIAVTIGCIIGLVGCAGAAIFIAARDTYPHRRSGD